MSSGYTCSVTYCPQRTSPRTWMIRQHVEDNYRVPVQTPPSQACKRSRTILVGNIPVLWSHIVLVDHVWCNGVWVELVTSQSFSVSDIPRNLKRESGLCAILPSHAKRSRCTSGFFVCFFVCFCFGKKNFLLSLMTFLYFSTHMLITHAHLHRSRNLRCLCLNDPEML